MIPTQTLPRRGLLSAALGGLLLACGSSKSGGAPGPLDAALEAGEPLVTTVTGYMGLEKLPYFELRNGRLVCTVEGMPGVVDVHGHLGFSIGNVSLDYLAATEKVEYLVDCDGAAPPCTLDLNIYSNMNATEAMIEQMNASIREGVLLSRGPSTTHTLPNLVAEMDDMKVQSAVLLPIAVGLLQPDDMTERWRKALDATNHGSRFVSFCSVHPSDSAAVSKLESYKALGYRGVKFHPTIQNVDPDAPASMAIFEACSRLGLPVFVHAGRAGIEPEETRAHAEMARYVAPLETFPKATFIFGHSGARDFEDAFALAKKHENVWLDVQGQGLTNLRTILAEYDSDRVLWGSDWPFYPLAFSLAKALIATDGNPTLRDKLLATNARRLLGLS